MAHLDDNARTGLHALALGAVIVGVPVLIVQLVDLWQTVQVTTDAHLLQIFRNGYLLSLDDPQLTCDATTRMERIGLSAAAALPVGVCCGLLGLPFKKKVLPWTIGRWSAFAVFLFLTWCSLTTPVRSTRLVDGKLRITERPALFGAIAMPWSASVHPVNAIGSISSEPMEGQRTSMLVEHEGTRVTIATTRAARPAVEAAMEYLDRVLHP